MDNYQNVKKTTDNISNLMNKIKKVKFTNKKNDLKEFEIDFKLSDEQVKITDDTNFALYIKIIKKNYNKYFVIISIKKHNISFVCNNKLSKSKNYVEEKITNIICELNKSLAIYNTILIFLFLTIYELFL